MNTLSAVPLNLEKSLTYQAYIDLVRDAVEAGESTGSDLPESYTHYTFLNDRRMRRYTKTIQLTETFAALIKAIDRPQTWVVLTEGWCGDASPFLPLLGKIEALNPFITLHVLLRDENLDIMDQYLTGTSRSIPKLVIFDHNGVEIGTWGPRPEPLARLVQEWKADPELDMGRVKELIQKWYAKDKGISTMQELSSLLTTHSTVQ